MTFISVVHIVLALLLIVLVLLQDSKGGGVGGAFGGGSGSNSLLGPTGATTFLAKLTRWTVIGFALTSIVLTNLTSKKEASALDGMPVQDAGTIPTNKAPAPSEQPAAAAPTDPATPPANK